MDVNILKELTNQFFHRHWYKEDNKPIPEWSENWNFLGELPKNTFKGCYAFLKGNEVCYVGMAMNKGIENYKNHSLGTRISNYWRVDKEAPRESGMRKYKPDENLLKNEISSIITLPFPEREQEYLIPALEYFLITNMKPVMNVRYK